MHKGSFEGLELLVCWFEVVLQLRKVQDCEISTWI